MSKNNREFLKQLELLRLAVEQLSEVPGKC